ncbi:DUF896 domain-containing protein [Limosilactobacillus coleohominis]|mgnify:CR=1 FL=1|jgi:uncharacterized protein YnzC (UPF0291/DUF896 family)|uniref:UPF0291 protein H5975_06590 n=1 Tax=Limosilactobacillus coleohominis TaxID=181675 RepID=A0ABS2GZV7_9LACO|nr:DUF896 domain-containing protein [Limosilactobacillus coleohominis]MBM6941133.1 DUF896 domain-containing protein [Limosilactobacillus coleohominis]MBM6954277.1 DUF896 domain-containing protein [Limosilactobacillus coleohominis]MCI5812290.1 DUF896 domain-containing protein [Lactobacillus sp.]MDY5629340.1 DUF896 domain-containing protein [Limosilactobacillus coleohominis]
MAEENEQDKLLKRINELAHKNKSEGLTEEEKIERKKLRDEYLKNFREAFKSKIEMTQIFDKNGKEVTPEKIKEIQRKKGLRDD